MGKNLRLEKMYTFPSLSILFFEVEAWGRGIRLSISFVGSLLQMLMKLEHISGLKNLHSR
jgi:hypothetical protein